MMEVEGMTRVWTLHEGGYSVANTGRMAAPQPFCFINPIGKDQEII